MRIVHVIRDLRVSTGGPVRALKGLAEAQAGAGHDVIVHAGDRGGAELVPSGVRVIRTRATKGGWGLAPMIGVALESSIRACDVVHLHMVWDYPVWVAARMARRFGKPFILRACGQLDRWSMSQSALKKRLYLRLFGTHVRHAAAFHFTTDGERESSLDMVGNRPTLVIPIGIEPSAFANLPEPSAFALRFSELRGRRLVLFLGRLHAKKQPEVLVEAFARACDMDPRLHLVLAGPVEADMSRILHSRVAARGITHRVTFTGTLEGPSVVEAYRAAEVFVLPSIQENFGLAIAEAMAAGCAVLVSDRVDLAADIVAADAGLTSRGDADSLSVALRTLLSDEQLRRRLGENGRALVLEKFTWDRIARATVDAYREIRQSYQAP